MKSDVSFTKSYREKKAAVLILQLCLHGNSRLLRVTAIQNLTQRERKWRSPAHLQRLPDPLLHGRQQGGQRRHPGDQLTALGAGLLEEREGQRSVEVSGGQWRPVKVNGGKWRSMKVSGGQ